MNGPLVILGCGFVGMEAARLALVEGREVIGTTRGSVRACEAGGKKFETRVVPALTAELVSLVDVPVVASGDITSRARAQARLKAGSSRRGSA